ncbi:MAG: lipid-A-disaccharide synthase [Bacteroidetes bacterium]|nr:lipid-A-disaccharide synthase [Bacteroidota bacterium]
MKYYIIAGEASGDLHGSNLMKELKKRDQNAEFRFWGGDLMLKQDDNLVKHYKELAFMGLVKVLQNLVKIIRNIRFCKNDIIRFRPDAVILIDYPGFNLKIACFAKLAGIRVYYYISPKVWAWKQSRVETIKTCVDKMFVIFPFEIDFYKKHNFDVDYVGNPILDSIEDKISSLLSKQEFLTKNNIGDNPIIALLPGSRKQEINKTLPVMLGITDRYSEHQFVIAGTSAISKDYYQSLIPEESDIIIVYDQTYALLKYSLAAVVTSGTATLEAALINVPEVVGYIADKLSFHIGKRFVKVPFISLVNLIMEKEVVKELIQDDMTSQALSEELNRLLFDIDYRENMVKNFQELRKKMGEPGASKRVAELMVQDLEKTKHHEA